MASLFVRKDKKPKKVLSRISKKLKPVKTKNRLLNISQTLMNKFGGQVLKKVKIKQKS